MSDILLCVNVDHIATLREARGGIEPDPVKGAVICEKNGAGGITVHLREDRRHIQDADVYALKEVVKGKFNLEMALSDEIIKIATEIVPEQVTLVPEKRQEITTEGGLDVIAHVNRLKEVVALFHEQNVLVSLFVEPDRNIVEKSKETGADFIEIHTGTYCNAQNKKDINIELERIYHAAQYAREVGIRINAGHGLNYDNIHPVLKTDSLEELNIGHSIISKSIFTSLAQAVMDMVKIIKK